MVWQFYKVSITFQLSDYNFPNQQLYCGQEYDL